MQARKACYSPALPENNNLCIPLRGAESKHAKRVIPRRRRGITIYVFLLGELKASTQSERSSGAAGGIIIFVFPLGELKANTQSGQFPGAAGGIIIFLRYIHIYMRYITR
jgi:hypothetical protein